MLRALDLIRADGRNRDLPYYAHPGMFRTRGRQLPNGTMQPMEDVPSVAELTAHGARVVSTREPQSFLDDMFSLSGEIPRVTPFETGLPLHFAKTETGWEADPLDRRRTLARRERRRQRRGRVHGLLACRGRQCTQRCARAVWWHSAPLRVGRTSSLGADREHNSGYG